MTRRWLLLFGLVAAATTVWAADRMLGVDTGMGVQEEMTPEDVGTFLNAAFTLQGVFGNGKEITGATSFANAALIGNGTDKWALYRDATRGLQFNCVVSGTENNCNYIRRLIAGKYFEIQNASGTSIFRVSNDTGELTNVIIKEETHWPVASCHGSTASAVYDLPASNAATAACLTGTNTQKGVLDFDATTDNAFQDHWILPAGFVAGSIDVHFRWLAASTSSSVAWCAQLIRVADGSTGDPAFPAQAIGNCVSDAAKGTTLQENTATIAGVTCSSCAAGDHVYVRISRDPDETSTRTDAMTGNARLVAYGRTWKVQK